MSNALVRCMSLHAHTPSSEVYRFMRADHARIENELRRLMETVKADDRETLRTDWPTLEREVTSHLEAEEHFMIPALATVEHDEAVVLLREHGQIRQALLELSVAIELHYVQLSQFRELIDLLHAHAEREDLVLYPWADSLLQPAQVRLVRAHIGR
jgi:hemerythrin-like domain-containing protein